MIDIGMLRKAVAPLTRVGRDEITFDVEGTRITLRSLLPIEEVAVQRFSQATLEEAQGDDDDNTLSRATAIEYFDQYRSEVLAHAVVAVGSLDLREVPEMTTGERLDDGTPVVVSRVSALRMMIRESWSRAMLSIAFYQYGELVQRLQDTADDLVRKSVADLDVEIGRLEKRLESARTERTKRAAGDPSIHASQVSSIIEADQLLERQRVDALNEAVAGAVVAPLPPPPVATPESPPPAEIAPPSPPRRASVIPPTVPPPGPPIPDKLRIDAAEAASMESITTLGGVEAMRLPPQVISDRGTTPPKSVEGANPVPKGAANPNFRPRR